MNGGVTVGFVSGVRVAPFGIQVEDKAGKGIWGLMVGPLWQICAHQRRSRFLILTVFKDETLGRSEARFPFGVGRTSGPQC